VRVIPILFTLGRVGLHDCAVASYRCEAYHEGSTATCLCHWTGLNTGSSLSGRHLCLYLLGEFHSGLLKHPFTTPIQDNCVSRAYIQISLHGTIDMGIERNNVFGLFPRSGNSFNPIKQKVSDS
jgi:hypothetical protein